MATSYLGLVGNYRLMRITSGSWWWLVFNDSNENDASQIRAKAPCSGVGTSKNCSVSQSEKLKKHGISLVATDTDLSFWPLWHLGTGCRPPSFDNWVATKISKHDWPFLPISTIIGCNQPLLTSINHRLSMISNYDRYQSVLTRMKSMSPTSGSFQRLIPGGMIAMHHGISWSHGDGDLFGDAPRNRW